MSDIGRTSLRARGFALMGGAAQLALLCSLGLTACASPSGLRLVSIRFTTRAAGQCKAKVTVVEVMMLGVLANVDEIGGPDSLGFGDPAMACKHLTDITWHFSGRRTVALEVLVIAASKGNAVFVDSPSLRSRRSVY